MANISKKKNFLTLRLGKEILTLRISQILWWMENNKSFQKEKFPPVRVGERNFNLANKPNTLVDGK
jgi:hypothetical protein